MSKNENILDFSAFSETFGEFLDIYIGRCDDIKLQFSVIHIIFTKSRKQYYANT